MSPTSSTADASELARIREAARLLRAAEQPVRVLRTIAWPRSVRERFLAAGGRELPVVGYTPLDPGPTLAKLDEVRPLCAGDGVVQAWLRRQVRAIETGARMLAAVGTPGFHAASVELYGAPTSPLPDEESTSLELARTVDGVVGGLVGVDLGAPAPACNLATGVAERMRAAVARFGDEAPEVVVVDELSSNAIAGPRAIRIRRDACFTDRDAEQLVQHEAYVHVATSLNGRAQTDLPILAAGHPGTTRTQEGLAVFAELITATLEPDRLRRLAHRVLAIQMAIEGADFLEVFRFFRESVATPEQAFENTRRVFRGGVLTGGAPFTKDVVYLDGLLRVHNFLRVAVGAGRADAIELCFCGKLDLEDLPALSRLRALGLCRPPAFVPPWIEDRRFLVAYLAYSGFLNRVRLDRIRTHYQQLLDELDRPIAAD